MKKKSAKRRAPQAKKKSSKKKQQALDRRLLELANDSIDKIKGQITKARKRIEQDMSSTLALSILNKAKNIRENLNKKRRTTRKTTKRK